MIPGMSVKSRGAIALNTTGCSVRYATPVRESLRKSSISSPAGITISNTVGSTGSFREACVTCHSNSLTTSPLDD